MLLAQLEIDLGRVDSVFRAQTQVLACLFVQTLFILLSASRRVSYLEFCNLLQVSLYCHGKCELLVIYAWSVLCKATSLTLFRVLVGLTECGSSAATPCL